MNQYLNRRSKAFYFPAPISYHGCRTDQEHRPRGAFSPFIPVFMQKESQCLDGLTQAHIIRQTCPQTYLTQESEPGITPELIRSELSLKSRRGFQFLKVYLLIDNIFKPTLDVKSYEIKPYPFSGKAQVQCLAEV